MQGTAGSLRVVDAQMILGSLNNDAVPRHVVQLRQVAGCETFGCFLDIWGQGGLIVGIHRLRGVAMQIQTPLDPTEHEWENAAALRIVVLIQQIHHQAVSGG